MPLVWLKSGRTLISESEIGFIFNYEVVGALTAKAMFVAMPHHSHYNKWQRPKLVTQNNKVPNHSQINKREVMGML